MLCGHQHIFIGANESSEFIAKVSGTEQSLICGIREKGRAFAQIPIKSSFSCITKIETIFTCVELDGITDVVTRIDTKINSEILKKNAKLILQKFGLDNQKASGVMFISKFDNVTVKVDPVVYVKEIDTLFYDTAYVSGTIAIALLESLKNQKEITKLEVIQPSGKQIFVNARRNKKQFIYAYIEELIELLEY